MKNILICLVAILAIGAVATSQSRRQTRTPQPKKQTTPDKEKTPEPEKEKEKPNPDAPKVVEGANSLAMTLWPKLQEAEGNILFSPLMLSASLTYAADAAKGKTSEQLLKAVGIELDEAKRTEAYASIFKTIKASSKRDKVKICEFFAACGFWTMQGIVPKQPFITKGEKYNAVADTVDFSNAKSAAEKINAWASEQTAKTITSVVCEDDFKESLPLALTATLTYKSPWMIKFKKSANSTGQFKVSADKSVNVEMMKITDTFKYAENENIKAVEIPYSGDEISLLIFVPKNDDGVAELQKSVSSEWLAEWTKHLASNTVALSIPKLKVAAPIKLAKPLQEIGVSEPFGDDADFSVAITGKIFLSQVIQNCCLDMSEDGSAPTPEMLQGTIFEDKPVEQETTATITADRPFVFIVRHSTVGAILMMGKIVNPETK